MELKKSRHDSFLLVLAFSFSINQAIAQELRAPKEKVAPKQAAELFENLMVQGTTHDHTPTKVEGAYDVNDGIVTFGAEKEATDYGIIHIMSPSAKRFEKFLDSLDTFGSKNKTLFLKEFLTKIAIEDPSFVNKEEVKDIKDRVYKINYEAFKGKDLEKMTNKEVDQLFHIWLDQTNDHPFSFLTPEAREKILNGELAGNDAKTARKDLAGKYYDWVPLFGKAEKYVHNSQPAADYIHRYAGYELLFNKMDSYGEFVEFMEWFQSVMKTGPEDNYAKVPGHNRIVWPAKIETSEEAAVSKKKMGEYYKNIQAYVVLKEILDHPGIMTAKWRDIIFDKDMAQLQTDKGPLRLEYGRWPNGHRSWKWTWKNNTEGLEFRAGMKTPLVQRFVQTSLVSRMATRDWSGLADTDSWKLVPYSLGALNTDIRIFARIGAISKLSGRFAVSYSTLNKFFTNIKRIHKEVDGVGGKRMDLRYLVPFWRWEEAPYISADKKKIITSLTRDFITFIADHGHKLNFVQMENAIQSWAKAANIDSDIENYLMPKRAIAENENPQDLVHPSNGRVADVNAIDVGIEFSGRLPIRDLNDMSDANEGPETLSAKKREWVTTTLGLTPAERETVIKNLALSLAKHLGFPADIKLVKLGEEPEVTGRPKQDKAHGHGISLGFKFANPNNPKEEWRTEWDGIGRSYDAQGNVIPNSTHGGHIELATSKGRLTTKGLLAVYKAFDENSVIPGDLGGGHINVDLAAFIGKPRALARFLTYFHKYRGTIAMLFQHPNRLKSAEAVIVSPQLHDQLRNFRGSEEDLKKLLYNERYFNMRLGRKSRYNQVDFTNYYQDVIPPQFVTQDFDINNPAEPWRQQFRVKPDMRKIEFRMMDAPKTAFESAKMLQLVRALLNKAINEDDGQEIVADVQQVNHQYFAEYPHETFEDLRKMTDELGLSYNDFKGFMGERIGRMKVLLGNKKFKPLTERTKFNPRLNRDDVWLKAVDARPENDKDGLNAKYRPWKIADGKTMTELVPESIKYRDDRVKRATVGEERRAEAMKQELAKKEEEIPCFKRLEAPIGMDFKSYVELVETAKKIQKQNLLTENHQ